LKTDENSPSVGNIQKNIFLLASKVTAEKSRIRIRTRNPVVLYGSFDPDPGSRIRNIGWKVGEKERCGYGSTI
jgi:hypothetical protein